LISCPVLGSFSVWFGVGVALRFSGVQHNGCVGMFFLPFGILRIFVFSLFPYWAVVLFLPFGYRSVVYSVIFVRLICFLLGVCNFGIS